MQDAARSREKADLCCLRLQVLLLLREVREVGDEVGRPGEKRAKVCYTNLKNT
jgi:hypothetical protein